ncbi:hypothetical protein D8X55_04425 [Malacoplasma penetrans]|nr:hypothetical protein D8X55_04425 [Malacoplasma penetrans]
MEGVSSMDKPSLHWSNKYYSKVNKIISKNDEFNFSGKTIIFKKVPTYYKISILDFLPVFIGWFHSLFTTCRAYGMIRSSSVFHTPLYKYFKRRFLTSMFVHFITGPLLFFIILFFAPVISIPWSEYISSWSRAAGSFFSAGGQEAGMTIFAQEIVVKFFSTSAWWVTLVIALCFNSLNVSTFVSSWCMNIHNNKWMKLIILENELKMKLSNFEKQRKGK